MAAWYVYIDFKSTALTTAFGYPVQDLSMWIGLGNIMSIDKTEDNKVGINGIGILL